MDKLHAYMHFYMHVHKAGYGKLQTQAAKIAYSADREE